MNQGFFSLEAPNIVERICPNANNLEDGPRQAEGRRQKEKKSRDKGETEYDSKATTEPYSNNSEPDAEYDDHNNFLKELRQTNEKLEQRLEES